MDNVNVKVLGLRFYVMGKALSGELSCTWTGLVIGRVSEVTNILTYSENSKLW